jgi:hypothetical protein
LFGSGLDQFVSSFDRAHVLSTFHFDAIRLTFQQGFCSMNSIDWRHTICH